MNVRADLVDWRYSAYLRSAKSVASCAILAVNRFSLGCQILLNGERVLGGWKRSQPVLNPFESREINAGGRDARAQRSAFVSLLHDRIVAIPVELHTLARFLVPNRRQVGRADKLFRRKFIHGEIEFERLIGIEGIHAAGSPAVGPQELKLLSLGD